MVDTIAPLPRLGKHLGVVHDPRTRMFAHYTDVNGIEVPDTINHSGAIVNGQPLQWQMYGNDSIGDCTCAAVGNATIALSRGAKVMPVADILTAYEAVAGYNPTTGANDNGAYCVDVLNYWRSTGFGSDKLVAWAKVDVTNEAEVKAALYLFGTVYTGFGLPVSAQKQDTWDVTDASLQGDAVPGSWGGHCIPLEDAGPDHGTIITWGATKRITWPFWHAYCDEAYAVISQDWLNRGGGDKTPQGFDLQQLQSDLAKVGVS